MRALSAAIAGQSIGMLLSTGMCLAGTGAWIGNGPDGGVTFAVDSHGGVLRIGTYDGVYESTDGGAHWSRLGGFARGTPVLNVATSPADPNIVIVGADQAYRSTDGGLHWVGSGIPRGHVAFHPLSPNHVLSADLGYSALRRSDDAGATWTATSLIAVDVAADPSQAGVFIASTPDGGVYRSFDDGVTWSLVGRDPVNIPFMLSPDPFSSDVILTAANNLDVGFAQRFNLDTNTYAYVVSTDYSSIVLADPLASGRFWYVGDLVNSGPLYTLFESTDHGGSFAPVGSIPGRLLAADPATAGLLYGTDALGFAISSDAGRTWQSRTQGVPLAQTNAVSIRPDMASEVLAAGDGYGVAISLDGGASWQSSNSGLTQIKVNTLARSPLDPLTVYAGTGNGLFRSADGGRNWSEVAIASYPNGSPYRIEHLAIDAGNPSLLVALPGWSGKPIWSDDAGVNWRSAQTNDGVFDLRAIPHANGGTRHVYALASQSYLAYRLYRASTHGDTFAQTGSDLLVSAVAVQPNNDDTLIAFARDGQGAHWNAYLSHDAGEHWELRGALALPSLGFEPQLSFDPCDPQTVHALAGNSSYASRDQGMTWQEEPIAIPVARFNQLDARCIDGTVVLAAATEDAGAQVRAGVFVDAIYADSFEMN